MLKAGNGSKKCQSFFLARIYKNLILLHVVDYTITMLCTSTNFASNNRWKQQNESSIKVTF